MKKTFLIIAFSACALVAASCGNNKSSKTEQNKTDEEITEAKIELAEGVLATLDSLEQKCVEAGADFEDVIGIITSALTDKQKMVKPDYLGGRIHRGCGRKIKRHALSDGGFVCLAEPDGEFLNGYA